MPPATPRRGLLASLGTAASLVAAVAAAFVTASGVVGFHGWASTGPARAVVIRAPVAIAAPVGRTDARAARRPGPTLPVGDRRRPHRAADRDAHARRSAPTGAVTISRVPHEPLGTAALAAAGGGPPTPVPAPAPAPPRAARALDGAADAIDRAATTAATAVREAIAPPLGAIGHGAEPPDEAGAAVAGAVEHAGDGLAQTVRGLVAG